MENQVGKRICVLTTSFPRSAEDDAAVFVRRLVNGYTEAGASGLVIVPRDKAEPLAEQIGNFKVLRYSYGIFRRGKLAFGMGIMPNIRKNPLVALQGPALLLLMFRCAYLARSEFDVVHANWAVSALPAYLLRKLAGKPFIVTLRGEDIKLLRNKFIRWVFRRLCLAAEGITAVNENFVRLIGDLRIKTGRGGARFVSNGVDLSDIEDSALNRFCEQQSLHRDGRYLVFVGSVVPRKRVEILVNLLTRPTLSEYTLLVCGRMEDEEYADHLLRIINRHQLLERVRFLGPVPPHQVAYVMSLPGYYLSASEFEGRSNSVLEAFAARMLVLASDISAHREVITSGENGYLFKENAELEQFIVELDRHPALAKGIAANAYSQVKKLTWKSCAERYLELF